MTASYMVECDFADPEREADWNVWYEAHIRRLIGVPGFRTAQRFKSVGPIRSPYLALYELDSVDVITSPAYRERGGPVAASQWAGLMVNWDRNLFEGNVGVPAVSDASLLLVVDRLTAGDPALPAGWGRFDCVGLDRSVLQRGVTVIPESGLADARAAVARECKVYKPLGIRLQA